MIRINDITTALRGLVGFGSAGSSGLDVLNAHPLLTAENIEAITPSVYNGNATKANKWLEDQQTAAIVQVVQRFCTDKQTWRQSRDLLQRKPFFDGAGRIKNVIANSNKVVGFEITPIRAMGVTVVIEKIGMQFARAVEPTNEINSMYVYLFHSSQPDPVRELRCDVKADGRFVWITPEEPLYLPYVRYDKPQDTDTQSGQVAVQAIEPAENRTTASYDGTNTGGAWYLVYAQGDLPQGYEAINVSKDWSRDPCGTCNIGSLQDWRELTKYVQIAPFMVAEQKNEFGRFNKKLWDVSEMMYTPTQSYGLNCIISVACDLSDFIISQKDNFAQTIQLQTAYNLLRAIAMNPFARVNRAQSNAMRSDILYELDGNTEGRPTGIGYRLEQAYKALRISTEGIDRICLACANKGVNYTIA